MCIHHRITLATIVISTGACAGREATPTAARLPIQFGPSSAINALEAKSATFECELNSELTTDSQIKSPAHHRMRRRLSDGSVIGLLGVRLC